MSFSFSDISNYRYIFLDVSYEMRPKKLTPETFSYSLDIFCPFLCEVSTNNCDDFYLLRISTFISIFYVIQFFGYK